MLAESMHISVLIRLHVWGTLEIQNSLLQQHLGENNVLQHGDKYCISTRLNKIGCFFSGSNLFHEYVYIFPVIETNLHFTFFLYNGISHELFPAFSMSACAQILLFGFARTLQAHLHLPFIFNYDNCFSFSFFLNFSCHMVVKQLSLKNTLHFLVFFQFLCLAIFNFQCLTGSAPLLPSL